MSNVYNTATNKREYKKSIKAFLEKTPFGNWLVNCYRKRWTTIYRSKFIPNQSGVFYEMNEEAGLMDIDIRFKRLSHGEPFEFPDMIAANKAIGLNFLTEDIHNVINIGSGVGTFENINAPLYPQTNFLASEMDINCTEWVRNNRPFANVEYSTESIGDILQHKGKFDLALSVDVIEHVKNYKEFLEEFSQLADRAVLTTPNRDRHVKQMKKPSYEYHVQEFNAGELYFILKMYYKRVVLFSAPDVLGTHLVKVGLYSTYNKLFAYCER